MEVRTLLFVKGTSAASKDLQTVTTEVTVNYHPDPESINILYKEVGLNYQNRIIAPAVEEVVKQVTANYNAEELITKRPLVMSDIEAEITNRLNTYNIITEVISITDFQFSNQGHYIDKLIFEIAKKRAIKQANQPESMPVKSESEQARYSLKNKMEELKG